MLLDLFEQSKTPIWLMRQAGRYLPEYLEIRKKAGSFLNLCYNPILASQVTIQPIERFDFDAAIIFSDILVIPHSMGLGLEFKEGEGPVIETITSLNDMSKINITNNWQLEKTYETIGLVRTKLSNSKPLIGFAGAPWTIAYYVIGANKEENSADYCRVFCYTNQKLLNELIDAITNQTIDYLLNQIKAGVNIIQIFDSWSSVLLESEFQRYVIEPTKKIVKAIKKLYPDFPIIGFPRGAGLLYEQYISETNVDAAGLDYMVPLSHAKHLQNKVVVQGNLDPCILLQDWSVIEPKVEEIMKNLANGRLVFNLGHGILPNTPISNVEKLVKYVKNYE